MTSSELVIEKEQWRNLNDLLSTCMQISRARDRQVKCQRPLLWPAWGNGGRSPQSAVLSDKLKSIMQPKPSLITNHRLSQLEFDHQYFQDRGTKKRKGFLRHQKWPDKSKWCWVESILDSETHSHNFTLRPSLLAPALGATSIRVTLNFCQWANGYCSSARVAMVVTGKSSWGFITGASSAWDGIFQTFFFSDLNVQKSSSLLNKFKIYMRLLGDIVRSLLPPSLKLKTLRGLLSSR